MCACFVNYRKYTTTINTSATPSHIFLRPFKDSVRHSIVDIDTMDLPTNTMNTKVNMMQTQMAMMSLTVASMQAQMKEMEAEIARLKMGIICRDEPPSPHSISDRLDVDDDDSEGYTSDNQDLSNLPIQTSQPKIEMAINRFVMVPINIDDDDSGYEDD